MRFRKLGVAVGVVGLMILAGCGQEAINRPYTLQEAQSNTLFTAFTQRSPKYLDPARSYSTDETPFTYSIYEPLYSYHYRSEEHTSELQSRFDLVCRLLLEKKLTREFRDNLNLFSLTRNMEIHRSKMTNKVILPHFF